MQGYLFFKNNLAMICKDTVNVRKEQVTSDSLPNLFHVNNATSFCTAEWAYHHRYTPKSNMNKSRLPSCCCHAVSMEAGEAVAHGCAHARSSASHVRGSTGFTQKISHHAETMQPDHQHMKNSEFTFSVQCFFSRDGFQSDLWKETYWIQHCSGRACVFFKSHHVYSDSCLI